ncbi:hypothetical protein E2C01_014234 [Portunus trituberculatus]|uniref:Uncharacterized protein n=1 Tax=Portunus trituberculatus TaxID=210409 RepID=A0A5B7DJD1_PORTR|nr:hypothetical protein [Portunus trituberculatus]
MEVEEKARNLHKTQNIPPKHLTTHSFNPQPFLLSHPLTTNTLSPLPYSTPRTRRPSCSTPHSTLSTTDTSRLPPTPSRWQDSLQVTHRSLASPLRVRTSTLTPPSYKDVRLPPRVISQRPSSLTAATLDAKTKKAPPVRSLPWGTPLIVPLHSLSIFSTLFFFCYSRGTDSQMRRSCARRGCEEAALGGKQLEEEEERA